MKYSFYFIKTLYDVGCKRVIGRLLNDIKKIFFKIIPSQFLSSLLKLYCSTPKFRRILNSFNKVQTSSKEENFIANEISFSFLNQKRRLSIPIEWNSKKYSQLWRFNLHYFNWGREFLEIKLKTGKWTHDSKYLKLLIDDWIDNNRLGIGDGWHSYTISLRIRNWILLFRICPELNNQFRIDSLWQQICWLYLNKEDYIGGNHWLENLISLIVGSLQFEGKKSEEIFKFSLKELEKEINNQILKDGGHYERSASYHLLILERLIELGLILENTNGVRPQWLVSAISKMINWSNSVKLRNGHFPIFNDSPEISCNIDSIINFGICYLTKTIFNEKGIRNILTQIYTSSNEWNLQLAKKDKKNYLTRLFDTGWIIARDKEGLELIIKVGDSCPKYLPAHAHSDLLSFDLYQNGIPIFIETGTSVYGNNKIRYYERSGAAHNVLQLAPFNRSNIIDWVEPIEVWGNFRAARKAKVKEKSCGLNDDGTIWIRGTNDSHQRFGAKHTRTVFLNLSCGNKIYFKVIDEIICNKKMHWRQFWHLGPDQSEDLLKEMILKLKEQFQFEEKWFFTWYSFGFGKRIRRKTLCLSGVIEPGTHRLANIVVF